MKLQLLKLTAAFIAVVSMQPVLAQLNVGVNFNNCDFIINGFN